MAARREPVAMAREEYALSARTLPSAARWIFVVSPASGAADGVVRWLVGWSPFLRAPAAC